WPMYDALLQSTSMRPNLFTTRFAARSISAREPISTRQDSARPPFCRISAAVFSASSPLTSVTSTQAPSSANTWLIACPMPWAAPVTIATLSLTRFIGLLQLQQLEGRTMDEGLDFLGS